nr:MAG TPA: hypothetical protein [Caudoviricetes sp.]
MKDTNFNKLRYLQILFSYHILLEKLRVMVLKVSRCRKKLY